MNYISGSTILPSAVSLGNAPAPATQATRDGARLQPGQVEIEFCTWWRGDIRQYQPALPDLHILREDNARLIAELARLELGEVLARMEQEHHVYVAYLRGTPVAYGWSAPKQASIGEVGLRFDIPSGHRYLWDFATLPAWRGQGLYPRLLQAIMEHEQASYFWIGHLAANLASAKGIAKAGFSRVGTIRLRPRARLTFVAAGPQRRAKAGARLLGRQTWRLLSPRSGEASLGRIYSLSKGR